MNPARVVREKVTVLNQTPSAFRSLIAADASAAEDLSTSLRLVIFGGEAVDLQSLRPWFQRHGERQRHLQRHNRQNQQQRIANRRPEVDIGSHATDELQRPVASLVAHGHHQRLGHRPGEEDRQKDPGWRQQ